MYASLYLFSAHRHGLNTPPSFLKLSLIPLQHIFTAKVRNSYVLIFCRPLTPPSYNGGDNAIRLYKILLFFKDIKDDNFTLKRTKCSLFGLMFCIIISVKIVQFIFTLFRVRFHFFCYPAFNSSTKLSLLFRRFFLGLNPVFLKNTDSKRS